MDGLYKVCLPALVQSYVFITSLSSITKTTIRHANKYFPDYIMD